MQSERNLAQHTLSWDRVCEASYSFSEAIHCSPNDPCVRAGSFRMLKIFLGNMRCSDILSTTSRLKEPLNIRKTWELYISGIIREISGFFPPKTSPDLWRKSGQIEHPDSGTGFLVSHPGSFNNRMQLIFRINPDLSKFLLMTDPFSYLLKATSTSNRTELSILQMEWLVHFHNFKSHKQ